jgi:hypothetical protein
VSRRKDGDIAKMILVNCPEAQVADDISVESPAASNQHVNNAA